MNHTNLLLPLFAALASACSSEPADPPAFATISPPWVFLAANDSVAVAVDTSRIIREADGRIQVRVRYEFSALQSLAASLTRAEPLNYRILESDEVTECTRPTAFVRRLIIIDAATGRRLGDDGPPMSDPTNEMIGIGGPPLCEILRERGLTGGGV